MGRGSSQARCGARERELAASSRSIVAVSRGILEDDVSRGILGRFSVVGGWRGAHQDARCLLNGVCRPPGTDEWKSSNTIRFVLLNI